MDNRKFGGKRVLAKCDIELKSADPFAHFSSYTKSGYIVMNIRGACLYPTETIDSKKLESYFPDGRFTTLAKLSVESPRQVTETLYSLQAEFVGLRKRAGGTGIAMKFVDITEDHLVTLERIVETFPPIGADEECSVPFEQIYTLERGPDFEIED